MNSVSREGLQQAFPGTEKLAKTISIVRKSQCLSRSRHSPERPLLSGRAGRYKPLQVKLPKLPDTGKSTPVKQESIPYNSDITRLFSHFAAEDMAVLLDSGHPARTSGRHDILSAWPEKYLQITNGHITCTDSDKNNQTLHSIDELKAALTTKGSSGQTTLPFTSGWIGFASYELSYALEPAIGASPFTPANLPDFLACYYTWAIVQDHHTKEAWLVYEDDTSTELIGKIRQRCEQPFHDEPFTIEEPFRQNLDYDSYRHLVERIQGYLDAGDCYQVNLAMQYTSSYSGSPFSAYRQLRTAVPSPCMAYLNLGKHQILSISPERLLAARGNNIETRPIKGTAPRHTDPAADRRQALALSSSTKNRAENLMIVDLLRNDFGRHCEAGSIRVSELFALESYENVHHLVSTINGRLKTGTSMWDAFFGCFPGGSITGAPKIRACQIIAELEPTAREIYCGSIFYASNTGNFDSSITIRTLLCENGTIKAWAGGGIVKDSTAADEYAECHAKIHRLLQALENQG